MAVLDLVAADEAADVLGELVEMFRAEHRRDPTEEELGRWAETLREAAEAEESAATVVAVVAGIATATMMTIWTRVANRGVLRAHFVLLDEDDLQFCRWNTLILCINT